MLEWRWYTWGMGEAAKKSPVPLTLEDWIALERETDERHELENGVLYAMSGSSTRHNRINANIFELLRPAEDQGCRRHLIDIKVWADGNGYYPDVILACEGEEDLYLEPYPCLLVEVLSPSTAYKDYNQKKQAYFTLPTLKQYMIVSVERRYVEVFTRGLLGWHFAEYSLESDTIALECVDLEIPLEGIYRNVRGLNA